MQEVPKKRIILVVEDESAILRVIKASLDRSVPNYEILGASSGEEGLAYYTEFAERIAMVLVDVTLPHMKGTDLVKRLRELNPKVKCILMTGHQYIEDIELSNIPLLSKPFTLADMLRVLGTVVCIEKSAGK